MEAETLPHHVIIKNQSGQRNIFHDAQSVGRSIGRMVGWSFVVPCQKVRRRKMKARKKERAGMTMARKGTADKERETGQRVGIANKEMRGYEEDRE